MFPKVKHILFWLLCILCVSFVVVLNTQSTEIIDRFYKEGRFDILNHLSAVQGDQPLDYYLGKIEDVCLGPVTNFTCHIFFALFGLLYLRAASAKFFCFSVFIFLVISKFHVLFYPPYGDAVGGPFAEALWLSQHHFDYVGLYHQTGYQFGGPKVYMFSIYPTYLALLLSWIPQTVAFFVINHLIVYFITAVVVTLIRSLTLKIFDPATALLSSMVVLTLPLFQSQTEAINMEMPCLFFSMLSLYDLSNRKMGRASLWAIAAVLVKGHGLVMCATVAAVTALLFCFDPKVKGNGKMLLPGMAVVIVGVFMVFSKFLIKDQHASAGMIHLFAGWPSLKGMFLPYLYLASVVVFAGSIWKEQGGRFKDSVKALFTPYFIQTVVMIAAGMWFALFLNFIAVSPRYKLELAPFLVLSLIFAVMKLSMMRRLAPLLLFISVGISSLASYGLLERPLKANYHVLLERSLEYRNDLKLNRRLARLLEEKYKGYTIGAPFIVAQMLAFPELGYVQSPLDVVVYGMPITYGNIKKFDGLKKMDIMKTIWVGMSADFFSNGDFTYPINRYDKVIENLMFGDNKVVLFMGGVAIEQKRYIIQQLEKKARQAI
ncbi:MAG TPA: hypothetical protein DD723_07230 [Candidatus Omnitrophica bacterium]|nr:MAG: hypothetical protein A2Z81_09140 [Omnitrophica WOR_2 bacterium GWA2_45_18]OGX18526.1 MAG: hypothetical protein A2Y04_03350 [Omnitrophica WOR_2 bacterium GWC2_45_7]HBR15317.1 hypothetical protein [Candidatus Omnitrophota bacterium]